MADFPTSVYSPRTKQNRSGVVYTPANTKQIFAEDVTKLDDEVVAIENFLLNYGLFSNKDFIRTSFESTEKWFDGGNGSFSVNFGEFYMSSGSVLNNSRYAFANGDPFVPDIFTKNPVFEIPLRLWYATSQLAYFGIGNLPYAGDDLFVGFKVLDGTLYACWGDGDGMYTSEISGITLTTLHRYKVVVTSLTSIKFYVDGVLKYTADSNLPASGEMLTIWSFYIKTTTSANRMMSVKSLSFYQDY